MRTLLLLFAIFSLTLRGQNFEKYCIEHLSNLTKTNNWHKYLPKPPKDEQEKIFRSALNDQTFSFSNVIDQSKLPDSVSVEGAWDSAFIAQHYFVDLDGDKDLDLVFNGAHYTGSTEGNVDVFINKKGAYTKVIATNGKMTFAQGKIDSVYAIVIYRYPIGNKIEHNVEAFSCEKDKVNSMASVTFFGDTPTGLTEAGEIELPFNTVMKISTKPPKSPSFIEVGTLKQVNQWKQTVPVKYYTVMNDKPGEEWYFIKLRSKDLIDGKYPEWKTVLAWMKK